MKNENLIQKVNDEIEQIKQSSDSYESYQLFVYNAIRRNFEAKFRKQRSVGELEAYYHELVKEVEYLNLKNGNSILFYLDMVMAKVYEWRKAIEERNKYHWVRMTKENYAKAKELGLCE